MKVFISLRTASLSGCWKANRANKFIGRGTRSSDCSKGFSKGNASTCLKKYEFEAKKTKNLVFLRFRVVLDGLERFGRPVGSLSTNCRRNWSWGQRVMIKKCAHIEVVVTSVVVNFFGFLVIARYPTVRLSRKLE